MPEHKEKYDFDYRIRSMCDVLEEMRKTLRTNNFSYLAGLIEEVQVMGNRMEDSLGVNRDVHRAAVELKKLKKEYDELIVEYNTIVDKFPKVGGSS